MAMESLSGSGSCVLGQDIEKKKETEHNNSSKKSKKTRELDRLPVDVKLIFM